MHMTGHTKRQIHLFVSSIVLVSVLCGSGVFAQIEGVSPLSDYMYKRDFARYEEIKKEANVQKRCDLLLAFTKERAISRMLLYAAGDYQQACITPEVDKKNWPKVISMEEGLLALLPSEQKVKSADIPVGVDEYLKGQLQPSVLAIHTRLFEAYQGSNNLPKAAETGEKLYALTGNAQMVPFLADIYLKMQNFDKYLSYGEKMLASTPIDKSYGTALQMADVYIKKQQTNKAVELLAKVMSVYADKVPPGVQEASWNATRALYYEVIASEAYSKKDYNKAMQLYGKLAQFAPQRDDAYYFIGMCKWQNKDQLGAIESFAKCVVMNKQYAAKARTYLEQLYKAEHSDSLDGLDQELEKAKSSLGIS
jgi:tetratricopeptide (TPR) repeat protein